MGSAGFAKIARRCGDISVGHGNANGLASSSYHCMTSYCIEFLHQGSLENITFSKHSFFLSNTSWRDGTKPGEDEMKLVMAYYTAIMSTRDHRTASTIDQACFHLFISMFVHSAKEEMKDWSNNHGL